MALVPCRECGQQVSTKAGTCPHCGVHNPKGGMDTSLRGNARGCVQLVVLLFVLGFAVVFIGLCAPMGG